MIDKLQNFILKCVIFEVEISTKRTEQGTPQSVCLLVLILLVINCQNKTHFKFLLMVNCIDSVLPKPPQIFTHCNMKCIK